MRQEILLTGKAMIARRQATQKFEEKLDRVDEAKLTISFVSLPGKPPSEVWTSWFPTPSWERDWLIEQAETALPEQVSGFAFNIQHGRLSWGADGATYAVILEVTQTALAGTLGIATYDGLKKLFRMLNRQENESNSKPLMPVTRQEAIARAEWLIRDNYKIEKSDDLTILEEENTLDTGSWRIVFRHVDSSQYEVELGLLGGVPTLSRIRRHG